MLRKLILSRKILAEAKQRCWNVSAKHSTAAQAKVKSQDYVPGNSYNGFVCKRNEFISDFNMKALIFEHEKTGLQYIHLDRNDSNNLFSINFRTTPFDSTGLPHILEASKITYC
jgi:hypothetical protein